MRLLAELHADGGIRIGIPGKDDTPRDMAALDQVRAWAADAARRGYPVVATGEVTAPLAEPVLEAINGAGAEVTVAAGTPEPWPDGLSGLQLAARHGWTKQVIDLLDRGASPEARLAELTPFRLAAAQGHIPVLRALRAAGVPDPVRVRRPPGSSPDTVVLRAYLTRKLRLTLLGLLVAPVVLGVVLALALREPAALSLAVVSIAVLPIIGIALSAMVGNRVAVDGTELYIGNLVRWKGPVDLRQLVALGYTPRYRKTPAYLRLIQTSAGPKLLPGSLVGFDPKVAKTIREQPGLRTLLVGMGSRYLVPGLPRFVGQCVAGTETVLSPPARAFLEQSGGFAERER